MIIQRRKFLIGLASSLAAPAIVKAANIMPVKMFKPAVSMQQILNYNASAQVRLDILYGAVNISPGWLLANAICPNELYFK